MAIKKLRVGVVGVGHIGSDHARLYAETPSAEFTAVYDVDVARGNTIGKKLAATSAGSLDEFIGMVDAASVATPTNTHYEIARSLLARGKHVLVEKPITDNTNAQFFYRHKMPSARHIFQKPIVGLGDTVAKRNRRLPAKATQFGDIEKFSRRAVRLGRVPGEFAIETSDITDQLRKVTD